MIATKLPDEVIKATPEIPWRKIRGMRILAAAPAIASTRTRSGSPCAMTSRNGMRASTLASDAGLTAPMLDLASGRPGVVLAGSAGAHPVDGGGRDGDRLGPRGRSSRQSVGQGGRPGQSCRHDHRQSSHPSVSDSHWKTPYGSMSTWHCNTRFRTSSIAPGSPPVGGMAKAGGDERPWPRRSFPRARVS